MEVSSLQGVLREGYPLYVYNCRLQTVSCVVRREEEEERERCEGDHDRLWKRLHRDSGTRAENCSVFLSGISSDCTDLQEIMT